MSIIFDLERTNQLNSLPDKDLVDLCPPIEPYQVTKSRLILTLEDNGTLQLVSLKNQVKKLRGLLKDKSPDRNLVDELIQERRQEYLSE
ncbi:MULTISPECIES: hypothetical protein [Microcystis]|uniref:hypothetical protein n=1 Tax=Microcystis TaxID=1125 RepID=UPI001F548857|nr:MULTISPECIES: hypothetical protein [Microcystis]UZO77274.1 hypothetical protein M8120_04575 [Microcystis aeruginosa str. Chao 1910]